MLSQTEGFFSLLRLSGVLLYEYITFFLYLFNVNGHLDCFPILANVNKHGDADISLR